MKYVKEYIHYLTERFRYTPRYNNKGYQAAEKLINELRSKTYKNLNDDELEEFKRAMLDHMDIEIPEYLREANDNGLLNDVEDESKDVVLDIDFEVEDEDGLTLGDDPEETGDFPGEERARPPKIRKKQREANAVKAKVARELLGPDSQLRPVINKIFLKVQKEIKKEAIAQKVPVTRINLDKLTIKR